MARVFALVVRCRVMMLFVYSRVGKNRDTRRESPAGEPGRPAPPLTVFHFEQKILAVQKPIAYTDLLCTVRYSYFVIKFEIVSLKLQESASSYMTYDII